MKAILFFIFSTCILTLNAQVLNQVGSSIKNGATTKAADFNRSRSNKEKNDLDKNNSKATEQNATEDINEESSPQPADPNAKKMERDYVFTFLLNYEMINYNPEGETTRKQMTYFFGDSCSLLSADGDLMLNDLRDKMTLILSEDAKTGFSSPYTETSAEAIGDMNRAIYAYKKTGNTKSILGHLCEEYSLLRENTVISTIWSAVENPLVKSQLNPKEISDQLLVGINSMNPDPNGFVMEFNQYDEEGRLINTVQVTALEAGEKILKLGEYEITTY